LQASYSGISIYPLKVIYLKSWYKRSFEAHKICCSK
jgi:hypothetical protein